MIALMLQDKHNGRLKRVAFMKDSMVEAIDQVSKYYPGFSIRSLIRMPKARSISEIV